MFGNSNKRWKLFTLFGHTAYVTPWFLVLVALFAFSGLRAGAGLQAVGQILIWAPVLFVGILFHEFGHAFAIQAFGYGASRIVLHGFGGVTVNDQRGTSPPGRSIVISLAGPAASILLGLLAAGGFAVYAGVSPLSGSSASGGFLASFLWTMALVNFVWAAFNLLPINPLDGGHVVLHGLRWGMNNQRKARRYSAISSLVFIGLLVLWALTTGSGSFSTLWVLILAGMFGMQNWRILQQSGGRSRRR